MSSITRHRDGHYSTRCPGCRNELGPYKSLKAGDSVFCSCGAVSEVNNSRTLVIVDRRQPTTRSS